MEIQTVYETREYTLFNGEIDRGFHDNKLFDWVTKDYPNYFWIPSSEKDVMVWGCDTGETVRVFKDLPQWLYVSTMKCTNPIFVRLDVGFPYVTGQSPVFPTFLFPFDPGKIYRIPISMKSLEIDNKDLSSFYITLKDAASRIFFRRDFEVVEKPYNARVFLLQNKYGLIESFWIDNLLEEKTVDGDTVRLLNEYKIDVSKVETVYTARTGSKRVREMQVLKGGVENEGNYIVTSPPEGHLPPAPSEGGGVLIPITILPMTLEVVDEEEDLQRAEFQFVLTQGAKALPLGYGGNISMNRIRGVFPPLGSVNFPLEVPMRIEFLETPKYVGELEEIKVTDRFGVTVPTTARVDGNAVVIDHAGLERGMEYTVVVPNGVFENVEGTQWNFTTIEDIAVTEFLPPSNSSNNSLTSQISVKFNQNIEEGDLSLISITPAVEFEAVVIENTLLLKHRGLENNRNYEVIVPVGTIEGLNETVVFEFGTIGEIELVSLMPPYFGDNVEIDAVICVVFNQTVFASEHIDITINNEQLTMNNVRWEVAGDRLFIYHPDFEYGKTYRCVIRGNSIVGYEETIVWNFSTLESEVIPFEISDISPKGDAVPVNSDIVVTFTHNITGEELGLIEVSKENGETIRVTPIVSGNTLTIHHEDFDFESRYFVKIPAGSIGEYGYDISFDFWTIFRIEILSILPNNKTNLETSGELILVFNQSIRAGSLGNIYLEGNDSPVTPTCQIDENRLIIAYENLTGGIDYKVVIPADSVLGYDRNVWFDISITDGEGEEIEIVEILPQEKTNLPKTGEITVVFNQNISASNLAEIYFKNENVRVEVLSHIEENRLLIEYENLMGSTNYNVVIPAGSVLGYDSEIVFEIVVEEEEEPPIKFPTPLFYVPLTVDKRPIIAWNNILTIGETQGNGTIIDGALNIPNNTSGMSMCWDSLIPQNKNLTFCYWMNPNYAASGLNFMFGWMYISQSGSGIAFSKLSPGNTNMFSTNGNINNTNNEMGLVPVNTWTFVCWTVKFNIPNITYTLYWNGVKKGEWIFNMPTFNRMSTERFSFGHYSNNNCPGNFKHFSVYEELTDKQVLDLYNNEGVPL
jgi:hypothetical protein